MSRLTVRLPETLHHQLLALAENEGISLNQYIVYALTRQATLAYTFQAVPEELADKQQASFAALLERLGQATFDEIELAMQEREENDPYSCCCRLSGSARPIIVERTSNDN